MDIKYFAAIKAREQAATPGPWESKTHHTKWSDAHEVLTSYELNASNPYTKADCDFIAHARTDIPALIAEVERLKNENAELNKSIETVCASAREHCDRADKFQKECDTLKKALELACEPYDYTDSGNTLAELYIQQAGRKCN